MKLLILTQVVDKNDPILGFFHRWIDEFAKHCERVTVICLRSGAYEFPENVRVFSLGKEGGESRFKYIVRFYTYIWQEKNNYDSVFVHMNHVYILLGGIFWRLMKKKIGLWYVHKSVTPALKVAVVLANIVFTTSPESFRVNTKKVNYVGHGIDIEKWGEIEIKKKHGFNVITAGRISSTKRIAEMIEAVKVLNLRGVRTTLTIVGASVTKEDEVYEKMIMDGAGPNVRFVGAIPHDQLPEKIAESDVFLNLSDTGSMDKAVLEAIAAGVPVVSSNAAFRDMLDEYDLFSKSAGVEDVARAIKNASESDTTDLRKSVIKNHALDSLIPKIVYKLTV